MMNEGIVDKEKPKPDVQDTNQTPTPNEALTAQIDTDMGPETQPGDIIQQQDLSKEKTPSKSRFIDFFSRLRVPFAPKIVIQEKLIDDEEEKDYALIRYYQPIQIIVGLVLLLVSIYLIFAESIIFILLTMFSIFLIFTGYEIEEIYVTTYRLLIRRIGLFERIIRIPSDEEHMIRHIVSFQYGRAPVQLFLVILGSLGIMVNSFSSFAIFARWMLLITSIGLFVFGMRLGRRILTLNLAGGHFVILGARKGVPVRLIDTLMLMLFEDPERFSSDRGAIEFDEKPVKPESK